jgi:hypothetical protein
MKPRDPSLSFKNPKHEQFALLVAGGAEIGAAYAASGFRPDKSNANRLYARCEGRINYIKASEVTPKAIEAAAAPMLAAVKEATEHFVASKEYALDALHEICEIGLGRKTITQKLIHKPGRDAEGNPRQPVVLELETTELNLTAANKAAELIGNAAGLFEEKTMADTDPNDAPIQSVSDDRAVAILDRHRERRAAQVSLVPRPRE